VLLKPHQRASGAAGPTWASIWPATGRTGGAGGATGMRVAASRPGRRPARRRAAAGPESASQRGQRDLRDLWCGYGVVTPAAVDRRPAARGWPRAGGGASG